MMKLHFSAKQMKPSGRKDTGDSQPPRKKVLVIAAISHMFPYSARKNRAKAMPEYSTMWPATISDSPSTTSNGARQVSATPDTRKTMNIDRKSKRLQSSH